MRLNIELTDLYYFDIYLSEVLIEKPANSLRSSGSVTEKSQGYQRLYEVSFKENGKESTFEILIQTTHNEIKPIKIHATKFDSVAEKNRLRKLLLSRIAEAEKKAIEKPMKTFEYEALLATGHYPIKSTIEFGKYKLCPTDERSEKGWLCKLRYSVNAINKDNSLTWATYEAREMAAFLSVIFCKLIQFHKFSDIIEDTESVINYENVERPDLRPVKHPFAGELKIPCDFLELWDNYQSSAPDVRTAFMSSCICFQVAKEISTVWNGIAYTLFVTAIEVIADKVFQGKPVARFKDFICHGIGRSDRDFMDQLGRLYNQRSEVLHNKGIGMGFFPIDGIISFDVVSGSDLWNLEIITNAALIGFLNKPILMKIG